RAGIARDSQGILQMMGGWRAGGLGLTILSGIVAAGIVHIVATIALPEFLRPDAFDRVTEHLPVNKLVVFGKPEPESQLVPYQEPDMHFALCRYDVSSGPVSA